MSADEAPSRWTDAVLAAALFAVDPVGTGGVVLHAFPGEVRDRWLSALRQNLVAGSPLRRIPLHVNDSRLLGGLDLAATLQAGRPVAERGVLAEADGGVVLLAMAERVSVSTAAKIAAALDAGEVRVERDGLTLTNPTRIGVVALDESLDAEEQVAVVLQDRLAFRVDLSALRRQEIGDSKLRSAAQLEAARRRLPAVASSTEIEEALCATASALGIASIRAVLLCHAAARAAAALAGRDEISEADATLAARLVLAPRATALPAMSPGEDDPDSRDDDDEQDPQPAADEQATAPAPAPEAPSQEEESGEADDPEMNPDKPFADVVLEAAIASIPSGLLAQLKSSAGAAPRNRSVGRAGMLRKSSRRGRPVGTVAGEPRAGIRLNLIETLRAAAPWQRLRRLENGADAAADPSTTRIHIRRADLRINRYKQRSQTTTIFALDASGSAALHRLAEAKGAVELLLNDCYVRRDRVAVIAFRGRTAELLLPPTRSLARAKRSLAGMPGGGGTPLATGIAAALALAETVARSGDTPTIVLLTDGRANVAQDGSGDRKRAEADASAMARQMSAAGFAVLFVDTSPRAQPAAARLAAEMHAAYLSLPYADAGALSAAVTAATPRVGVR